MRLPWAAAPVVAYLAAALPAQAWAMLEGPLPWLNYGHGWPSALAYGIAAPWVVYLLWRRSPRGRMAAYVFLVFDAVRSVRFGHPLPLALDGAVVLYLLTPAMRALYPPMWSRMRTRRRASV